MGRCDSAERNSGRRLLHIRTGVTVDALTRNFGICGRASRSLTSLRCQSRMPYDRQLGRT